MTLDRAFRWRHRMLKEPIGHRSKAVKGILEVDESHFKSSRKGQRGLGPAARKRGGRAAYKGRFSSDFIPVLVGRVRGQPYTLEKAMAWSTPYLSPTMKIGRSVVHSRAYQIRICFRYQKPCCAGLSRKSPTTSCSQPHRRLLTGA